MNHTFKLTFVIDISDSFITYDRITIDCDLLPCNIYFLPWDKYRGYFVNNLHVKGDCLIFGSKHGGAPIQIDKVTVKYMSCMCMILDVISKHARASKLFKMYYVYDGKRYALFS
jgi:hypothetical protein